MERVWIGQHNDGENHRTPPKFRHSLWNVYQLVLNDVPKTNNAVEGWHRGLMSQFNSQHPDIWKCINGLKNEQAGAALKREHHLAGILPAAKRKKYLNVHNNVQRIVREYTDDTILWDYLLRISYQIHK
ncbi:Uncharacterized protein FKW44_008267 [Caligus rogercresseyi]|uniref:Uncharacterized protein n=1 Tax=Caligus rogercresseyi TaxID=217165 RepID=A0A7T8KFV2_CALRO|nr:Uncharacterized protein FKW44_008267 [Caligus rogercresseyi]